MNYIESLLSQLTLEEKISMIHGSGLFETAGVPRLGIPPLKFSDGPMGIRNEFRRDRWVPCGVADAITYLPSGGALAATWNPDCAHKLGQTLGAEARGRGKDVVLAPGINIKRTPLCGRNFEYMSEDPYLIAQMVVPLIKGIQENDVAACVKHFACNNQEVGRMGVDVEVDEEALREIYLPGFEAAVKEGDSYTIMCAYNKFRGHYAGHSAELLDKILRDEWGFTGAVISDWGAIHDTEEAARVGMDVEMSYTNNFDDYYFAKPLLEAVRDGRISQELIDKKVLRVLGLMKKLKMLGDERASRSTGCYNIPEHREAAYEIASESIVLLKNEQKRLPLNPVELNKLLVIGSNATELHARLGGSAELKVLYEVSPLLGLCGRLGGNAEVRFAPGYMTEVMPPSTNDDLQTVSPESVVFVRTQPPPDDAHLRAEAIKLAAEYEQVIFIGGLNHLHDSEGADRADMNLPYRQDELIEELIAVNPDIIIVMVAGSPVDMSRWADRAKAIVWCWYAGCEGGHALADILLGKINPSGRLPETFAKKLTDYSSHSIGEYPGSGNNDDYGTVRYLEGNKVGYRHFDTAGIEPLFPFGHGLSYTEFELSGLSIDGVNVECVVENTGSRAGKAVVQLYAGLSLRAFRKADLSPGSAAKLCFTLGDTDKGEIRIGFSSRDIRLTGEIK
jgi:beta-glucosidase